MAEAATTPAKKSSWTAPPLALEAGAAGIAAGKRAKAAAIEAGVALRGGLAKGAHRVEEALESGAGAVGHALEDPTNSLAAELVGQANLPELDAAHPMVSLAVRLDREADMWRGLALRELARAAWMDRFAVVCTTVPLVGTALLAGIAGFRALFAPEKAGLSVMLLGAATLVLTAGALGVVRAATRVRTNQAATAREALARADLAEMRLHRVAALMALEATDPEGHRAALRGLEADVQRA